MHIDLTHALRAEIKRMRSLGAARARAKRCPRRLGTPAEAQSREPLGRFLGETQIAANDPERAECEGQGVTLAYEIGAASSSTPLRSPKAASASSLAAALSTANVSTE